MNEVKENTNKIDNKDLKKLFIRSNALQSAFNYERMQNLGFIWALIPLLNKLYTKKEERIAAYKRHMGYFNTNPWTSGVIFGIIASMEEKRAQGENVTEGNMQAIKGALMGPLAGLGDSLFWSTFRPIVAGVCASLALSGSSIAPIIFLVVINVVHFGVQWWGVKNGYTLADNFLNKMESMQLKKWMEAATILGLLVVGALVATWLNVSTPLTYTLGTASVSLQNMFDTILPKLLPLCSTLIIFAALRKGKSTMQTMLWVIVIGFVLGFIGVL